MPARAFEEGGTRELTDFGPGDDPVALNPVLS